MIIVGIKNGLGNQMFQYAFGKVLEWKYNTEIYFDIMNDDFASNLQTDADVFNIGKYLVVNKNKVEKFKPFSIAQFRIKKKYLTYLYYKLRRLYSSSKLVLESCPSKYNNYFETLSLKRDYYFMGHWMNLKYFEGYEQDIKKIFELKDKTFYQSYMAREIITSDYDTVSLHIRRGDYLTTDFVDTKGQDYYKKALMIIKEKLKNPFVYIFTNDAEWVKSEMKLEFPMKIIEGNIGAYSYKDMVLMSLCKNNIIANSSFSWWGAYLNKNAEPIVITPCKWFSDDYRNKYVNKMLPTSWIKI